MPWTVRDDGEPIYTKEPGDDFRDVEAGLVDLINERDALVEQLRVAHDLGTIAAAERDARSALNDTLSQIINDLTAERDALQALNDAQHGIIEELGDQRDALQSLVNDLPAGPLDLIEGQWYIEASSDLLARLDAAAKDDQ